MFVAIGFVSCKKEITKQSEQNGVKTNNNKQQVDGVIVLGNQLPNPFTIENMSAAFENIKVNYPGLVSPVRITNKYIKINVQDELQLSILKQDSNLVYYPYPLDYEITTSGTYYRHEEGQCDSCVTAQFAAIKANQTLPSGIGSTLLANLYIPTQDELLPAMFQGDLYEDFQEALTAEAFRLVGLNIETNPGGSQLKTTKKSKWRPAGRIRVWDNVNNVFVGVEGVEVRARRWFETVRGLTNGSGDYSCDGEYKEDANYSIQWDRKHFSIRSGTYGQAVYDGPKQKGNWNLDLNTGSQMFYARIFRAAYQYYYQDIDGLTRPPTNDNIIDPQLKIAVFNQNNSDINGVASPWKRFLGLNNFIKLYNPDRRIDNIHGTTIHELAHAAHWKICSPKSNYNGSDDIVAESWARGVQWWLTRKYYSGYSPYYNSVYTGVVEDMVDGIGGYDGVNNYTIVELEQAVKNKKTWSDWKNNIKTMYSNATESNLDPLFDHWD